MLANKLWTMKVSKDDKAAILRVAKNLRLTQSGAVKFLIRAADEFTRDQKPEEREPIKA